MTLTPAKAEELQSLVGTMIQLQYLSSDEVPGDTSPRSSRCRSRRTRRPTRATFAADVVIFSGNARQIMLLSEAARAAGAFETGTTMGRPACAMLPQAIGTASSVASIGCIGNRVYTELADDELYLTVPANALDAMLDKLAHDRHRQRRAREVSSPARRHARHLEHLPDSPQVGDMRAVFVEYVWNTAALAQGKTVQAIATDVEAAASAFQNELRDTGWIDPHRHVTPAGPFDPPGVCRKPVPTS